jgi:hypothetical protein
MVQVKQFGTVSQGESIRWGWLGPTKSKVWLLANLSQILSLFLGNPVARVMIFQTLWDQSSHTHTHYMSWAGYLHYLGRVTFVSAILVYHLHVLIILTCSMTSFSDKNTCVCYNTSEGPYFAAFSLFKHFFSDYVFDNCWTYITLFPGSFWDR